VSGSGSFVPYRIHLPFHFSSFSQKDSSRAVVEHAFRQPLATMFGNRNGPTALKVGLQNQGSFVDV
jgi:hypothetical protein